MSNEFDLNLDECNVILLEAKSTCYYNFKYIDPNELTQCIEWCNNCIGTRGQRWIHILYYFNAVFYFMDQEDLTLFQLTWGDLT